jgi:ATPase subunit of ABC transporter with duplicated ATPase domains
MHSRSILSAWLRWRYRQAVTLTTHAFYACNPLLTMILIGNRRTADDYLRPLENARLQEELAERDWRSLRARAQRRSE